MHKMLQVCGLFVFCCVNVHPGDVVPLDVAAVAGRHKTREGHLKQSHLKQKTPMTPWPCAYSEIISQGEQLPALVREVVDQLGVLAVPAPSRNLIHKTGNIISVGERYALAGEGLLQLEDGRLDGACAVPLEHGGDHRERCRTQNITTNGF